MSKLEVLLRITGSIAPGLVVSVRTLEDVRIAQEMKT